MATEQQTKVEVLIIHVKIKIRAAESEFSVLLIFNQLFCAGRGEKFVLEVFDPANYVKNGTTFYFPLILQAVTEE